MKNFCLMIGAGCAVVVVGGYGTRVWAQSTDYGSLEDLFGEPITSSATGTPQKASETPADMTIITADEIRQSGSRNIPQILSRVPGLDILQTGLNVFDVGVRGYQQPFQPRLLVLVDGRQVFLDDYSRTAWENIPVNVDDIRQIEVVKGASSALFGSNASGGVINIITYSPIYDHDNVASGSLGTQSVKTGDATTTINGDWGGTKFTVGGLDANEFSTYRSPLDQPASPPRHLYAVNSSVFQLTPESQIFTEATYSSSTGNTADPVDGSLMGEERIDTYSVRGGVNWQTPYGLITQDNYLNHSYIALNEPTDGGAPYSTRIDLFNSSLQDQFKVGANNTFRIGMEYKYKRFAMDGAQILEPESPALAENNYAINGTWLWKINDAVSWTNAGRYDYLNMDEIGTLMTDAFNSPSNYSQSLSAWSANSDVVYKATDRDSFRIGYGRGVQLPSLINSGYGLFQQFGSLGASDWEGNPYLKPTTVDDYSMDYTRKLPEISSFLKVGPYYEINRDIVSPLVQISTITVDGTSYPFGESINVGNSYGYGAEIQLKGKSDSGFRWDASYSYAHVHDDASVIASSVNYQGSAPQHHYRLLLGYTTGPWEFDGSGQYVTSTDMSRSYDGGVTTLPVSANGYSTFGARIGYQIDDHFTAALSGTNLNSNVLYTSPYPAIERELLATLTGRF